jgi:hypothetical protein
VHVFTIQAIDSEGTALTTAVSGVTIAHRGTMLRRLHEVKTGQAPTGARHRVATFIVLGGPEVVDTYSRRAGRIVLDRTGELLADALAEPAGGTCRSCGDEADHWGRTTTGSRIRLCTGCAETIDLTA